MAARSISTTRRPVPGTRGRRCPDRRPCCPLHRGNTKHCGGESRFGAVPPGRRTMAYFTRRIVVVGTGYVGLTTGACLASLGHRVVCTDVDRAKVERLRAA